MFKGMQPSEFNDAFQCEEDCMKYLFDLKWKEGFSCRRCGNSRYIKGRTSYHARCANCGYDESITAHTAFHRLQFSLKKAFEMAFHIIVLKKGISSVDLSQIFNVNQKTAWLFKRKLRDVMWQDVSADTTVSEERIVDGIILKHECEDTNGLQRVRLGLRRGGNLTHANASRPLSYVFHNSVGEPCSLLAGHYTDEGKSILLWNFKVWLTGIHHHCSKKFLQGYINEYFFKLNYGKKRQTIWHKLMQRVVANPCSIA